jgi:hypothetical protein
VQVLRHLEPWAMACDSYVGGLGWVEVIADRVGVPRRFISLFLTFGVVAFLMFGLGQTLVATMVGVVYPAYQCVLGAGLLAPLRCCCVRLTPPPT